MSGTIIAQHSCKSEYQDRVYGKGMRVFNVGKTPDIRGCTVCQPISRIKKLMNHAAQHDPKKHG
jgi:hypothetical protein